MKISHYITQALRKKAESEKAQAIAALEILLNNPSGIGEHTADGLFEDAEKSLEMLSNADGKLEILDKYFSGKEVLNG